MVKIENLNLEVFGIIYLIRNKVNGKYYIGQTQEERGFDDRYSRSGEGIERVYKCHKHLKEHNKSYNKHLLGSIEKYGFEAFEVNKCLDYAFSLEELNIKERAYIQLYNSLKNGYNETLGGEGTEGRPHSEETRKRLSEINKGKHHSEEAKQRMSESHKGYSPSEETRQRLSEINKGKHLSEEHRQKLSESHKGYSPSEETRQKISEARKGKHHPEEAKQRMSESHKGENNPMYGMKGENHPRAKAVYCYEFDEIRLTTKEWSEELCLDISNMIKCCKGKLKSIHGYHFRYATEEEIQLYRQKLNNELSEGSIKNTSFYHAIK